MVSGKGWVVVQPHYQREFTEKTTKAVNNRLQVFLESFQATFRTIFSPAGLSRDLLAVGGK